MLDEVIHPDAKPEEIAQRDNAYETRCREARANYPLERLPGESDLDLVKRIATILDIVYGDTDSVMIHTRGYNVARAMALGQVAAPWISKYFFDAPKKLAFEKVYWPFYLIEKKRYAGNWWQRSIEKYDKTDIKGLEAVRRDSCKLVSNTVDAMIKKLLSTCNVGEMVKVACDGIDQIRSDTIDPYLLKISKALSKRPEDYDPVPPHARLAMKMAKREARLWLEQLTEKEMMVRMLAMEAKWNPITLERDDEGYRKAKREELVDEAKADDKITASSPHMGDRVSYFVVARGAAKGKHKLKTSDKAEDPEYVLKHRMPFDKQYYLENQLYGPVSRLLEPLVPGCTNKIISNSKCTLYIPRGGVTAIMAARSHVVKPPEQPVIPKAPKKPSKKQPLPGQLTLQGMLLAAPQKKRSSEEIEREIYHEGLRKKKKLLEAVTVDGQRQLYSDVLVTAPKYDLERPVEGAVVITRDPKMHTASVATTESSIGHYGTLASMCLSCNMIMKDQMDPEQSIPFCLDCMPAEPTLVPDTHEYERNMAKHRQAVAKVWDQRLHDSVELYKKCWSVCTLCQKAPNIEGLSECRNTDCSIFFKREQIKDRKQSTERIAARLQRKPIEIQYES